MPLVPPHDAPSRRRTVLAVATRRPFALIGVPADARRALVLEFGPCVVFPTITHFRAAERERWAGVLVTRAGAWDPWLDTAVRSRSAVALVEVELAHEWPTEVTRVNDEAELRAWLEVCRAEGTQSRAASPRAPSASTRSSVPAHAFDGASSIPPAHTEAVETRTYARPRSELLIVAKEPRLRSQLFRALRGARPVRVLSELSELAEGDHNPRKWLGVVVADVQASAEVARKLARADSVFCPIDPDAAIDEASLRRWLLRAVAYEYTAHSGVSDALAQIFVSAEESAYMQSVETAALYTTSLASHLRAVALDMTGHTWRWYAKEAARILGESSRVVARRALVAADLDTLLPPSRWLAADVVEEPDLWGSLRDRIPRDLRSAPLSRVPWSDGKLLDVLRAANDHGTRTVDELLSLSLDALGGHWANPRTCDALQDALLGTLPATSHALPDEATSFTAFVLALGTAMSSEEDALPLRREGASVRPTSGTLRSLRFHEASLGGLRERLDQVLRQPVTLDGLRERDPYFHDLVSLEELEHFARVILRMQVYLSRDELGATVISTARPSRPTLRAPTGGSVRPHYSERVRAAASIPVHVEDGLTLAEAALHREGKPMLRADLVLALGAAAQEALYRMAGKRPFVEIDSRTWGLIERDLPGGSEAFEVALETVRSTIPRTAAITDELVATVRALSDAHRAWSREMVATAVRCARSQQA